MALTKHLFVYYATAALILKIAAAFVADQGMGLDCDPCINRPTYRIKVIVHGTSRDRFWQRIRASSIQAGKDMRVNLEFDLYDFFDPEVMAADIEYAAKGPSSPDALIVSIPSDVVATAVKEAANYLPVFGMNSGYDIYNIGVLDFIAMDEDRGGQLAAEEFLKVDSSITNALYINHEKGNRALDRRMNGFQKGLGSTVSIDELVVNVTAPDNTAITSIASALDGCKYDAILLAGSDATLDLTLPVVDLKCSNSKISVGTFDEGVKVYEGIATGKISFTISQQAHLQATLSVMAAAIYATTEKKLSSSQAAFGAYFSGPVAINFSNLPSDTIQKCVEDSFPVCPNNLAINNITRSSCDCFDRSKIKIAGVLHGVTVDPFWDVVFQQAIQAADDLGVELKLNRFRPQPTSEILHTKMNKQIISLCNEGVDGIFVSIPSELVHPAIQHCHELNIPVISVNAGASSVETLEIVHHLAQPEYETGFQAGRIMAVEGILAGICLHHDESNSAFLERCNGFKDGMRSVSENITYLGSHVVPFDSKLIYLDEVEEILNMSGDLDGIGALNMCPTTIEALTALKDRHPKLLVGTFDVNNEVYEGLDTGALLFGIDQNPFMQGYMPVWLLTTMAHTKQHLQNRYIQTGPWFVGEAPSNSLQICTANDFEVCPRPVDYKLNQLTKIRPYGLTLAGVSMFLSIGLLAWVGYYRNASVVRKSQPLFLGMICVGTFLMAATIIPLSIDDSIASVESCSRACMATPWLFWIGFIFTFSALFSKIDRIKKLIDSSESFRRVTITAWDVMLPFGILLALTLIFLLVWTVVDPMFWVRKDVFGTTDGLSTFGSCGIGHTNVSKAMLACLIVLAFACVIRACVSAWYGRTVSVEYSESRYVSVIVIGMLQAFPIGIPLIVLSYSNPTAKYFVEAAIIFVLTMSILLLIFIPKMLFLRKERRHAMDRASHSSDHSFSNGAESYIHSLKVMGQKRFSKESRKETQMAIQIDSLEATEIVSGITKREVEDLRQLLIQIGTIDDMTDLRSLVQSIGIVISDDELFRGDQWKSAMDDISEEEYQDPTVSEEEDQEHA